MRVGSDEAFDFVGEETRFEQRIENCVLRYQFISDRVSDRLGQSCAMPRNHSLGPDGDAEKFYRLVWMEEHPDRQPRSAVTMHRRDDDDGQADQNLEGGRINMSPPRSIQRIVY